MSVHVHDLVLTHHLANIHYIKIAAITTVLGHRRLLYIVSSQVQNIFHPSLNNAMCLVNALEYDRLTSLYIPRKSTSEPFESTKWDSNCHSLQYTCISQPGSLI